MSQLVPEIVQKPALTLVGCEAPFIHALSPQANNFAVIPPLWNSLIQRVGEIPGRVGTDMVGLIFGRPEGERLHPDELQYVAAVPVADTSPGEPARIPAGMVCRTAAAATYAVFVLRGPIRGIGETCRHIYRRWLPASGYRHSGNADIEWYDHRFCVDGPDSEMEIWVSIVPKDSAVQPARRTVQWS